MLKSLVVITLAFGLLGAALSAQQAPQGGYTPPTRGASPTNSPEPITMMVLAGGAAAAGALAHRRRKNK
jgi:hypothetical protein